MAVLPYTEDIGRLKCPPAPFGEDIVVEYLITWKRGPKFSALEGGSGEYKLYISFHCSSFHLRLQEI